MPVDGVSQPQKSVVINFIRLVFVLIPFLCSFIGVFIKLRFPIRSKEVAQNISHGIELHKQDKPAIDPLFGNKVTLLKLSPEEEIKVGNHVGNDHLLHNLLIYR